MIYPFDRSGKKMLIPIAKSANVSAERDRLYRQSYSLLPHGRTQVLDLRSSFTFHLQPSTVPFNKEMPFFSDSRNIDINGGNFTDISIGVINTFSAGQGMLNVCLINRIKWLTSS
jgi:hypothetical protein